MSSPAPRPRQVSFGSTLVIVGSVFVVFQAWDWVAGLHTLETQEDLRLQLSQPPASGLGLDVDTLQDLLRVASFVAAATAAATAVLGGYALARSTGARRALSVLALPMLAAGLPTAGLLAVLVVVGVGMLWTAPATAWFAGRPLPDAGPASGSGDGAAGRAGSPGGWPPPGGPSTDGPSAEGPAGEGPAGNAPATVAGGGVAAPPRQDGPPAPWGTRPAERVPDHVLRPGPGPGAPRPGAVVWACVLTWVGCGLVAVGLGLTALVVGLADDTFFDQLRAQEPALDQSGFADGEIRAAIVVMAAVLVPWSVAAAGLAVLVFRRSAWARIALGVSAGLAAALVLLAAVSSPPVVLAAVPLGATVVLLGRPEVSAWFRSAPRR